MTAYGKLFAQVYDARWRGFAETVAPRIRALYEATPLGADERTLLDVGCGTGRLASHFLEHGYRVLGVDLSPHMLRRAEQNNAAHVASGRALFVEGDAAALHVDGAFGLAVSTYDTLNHLAGMPELEACLRGVHAALVPGGLFVFDLNTKKGLLENWNGILVDDTDELTLIRRGIYDGGSHATLRVTGQVRRADGLYERFTESFTNTAFELEAVARAAHDAGFEAVHFAEGGALAASVAEPEALARAFVVARR